MTRRDVRVSSQFFEDLDRQLDMERGPNGEPSAIDFQSIELLEIVELFATGFDQLPPVFDDRSDYRVLVKSGTLVRAIKVVGVLASDDGSNSSASILTSPWIGTESPRAESNC